MVNFFESGSDLLGPLFFEDIVKFLLISSILLYIYRMRFQIIIPIIFIISFAGFQAPVAAQQSSDPRGAFFRSLAIPGLGHYYADSDNWGRGKLHLGAEAALIATFIGVHSRISNLEQQYITLASLKAGVDISEKSRSFRLAVGDHVNLYEYNDFQLRSRNWHRLLDETPENQWDWADEKNRNEYNRLRSDRDRSRNQLPAIAGLMVVNRVVSALSAYNRTRNESNGHTLTFLPVSLHQGENGFVASVLIRF